MWMAPSPGTDWKKHKPSCKRFSASNTVTVKPRYVNNPHAGMIPNQDLCRVVSGSCPPQALRLQSLSHEATKYPMKIIIKVQIAKIPPGAPMLVYDAKRELICHLAREDAPAEFDRLTEIIRDKGTFGSKAYFPADLKSKDQLVIKIDETLAEQPF
jgi:hypothetical protein